MPNNNRYMYNTGIRLSLPLTTLTAIIATSGNITTATGHKGRLRSCNIDNNTMIARGKTVMLSSKPPMR